MTASKPSPPEAPATLRPAAPRASRRRRSMRPGGRPPAVPRRRRRNTVSGGTCPQAPGTARHARQAPRRGRRQGRGSPRKRARGAETTMTSMPLTGSKRELPVSSSAMNRASRLKNRSSTATRFSSAKPCAAAENQAQPGVAQREGRDEHRKRHRRRAARSRGYRHRPQRPAERGGHRQKHRTARIGRSRARRPRATSAPRRRASQATRRESPAPAGTPPRNTPRRAAPRGRSAAAGGIARISAPRRGTADSPRRGSEKTDCLCRLLPYGNYMPRAAHNLSFGNCQNGEAVVKSFEYI